MPRPIVWTAEMDARLFKLAYEGKTDDEIGRILDKSPQNIQVRRCKLSISRDHFRINNTKRIKGLTREEFEKWERMKRLYPDE